MVKEILIAASLLFATGVEYTNAQSSKERLEQKKASKKELNEKSSKAARNEAKKLTKEKWKVAPGALPIERQLDRAYLMQYEFDDEGFPKYLMAEAMSFGQTYDAAKMQAFELAKQNLAGQIQSEVVALVENTVANNQITQDEAASITKTVMSSKNLIQQSIGRLIPIVEVYREINGNNREVLVRIAYNQNMAKEAAKRMIKKDLEAKGDSLHEKLNEIIGW